MSKQYPQFGEVQLRDRNWYPCEIVGSHTAMDYDGIRYDIRLSEGVSVTDPDSGHQHVYWSGNEFRDCHRDCVRFMDGSTS